MRGSEFAELRAFITVVEHGNFGRAAGALRVSPSTLSQTIRELEERLQVRLLNRTTRSVSLTEAGQRLLSRFKPALQEMEAAVEDARNLHDRPAGTVRLHASRSASVIVVEPQLGAFLGRYPDIVLDLTVDDAVTNIVETGFDVGIRLGELLEEDMVAVRIGHDLRQIAVASPEYIARHGAPKVPADLHAHRCINWRWPGQSGLYNWEFAEKGRWFSVAVNGPLIVSDRNAAISAALQGVGIAFWCDFAVRSHIEAGRLVPLLEKFSPPFSGWHLCYPRQRHMSAPVRALVDFFRQTQPPNRG